MRVRTLAFTYMIVVSCLAIGGAAAVWARNWTFLSEVHEGHKLIEALAPGVKFVESLALERGVFNQVLVSKATRAAEARAILEARFAVTDQLFAETLAKAQGLSRALRPRIVDPVAHARQIVVDARREADRFVSDDMPPSTDAAGKLVQHYVEAGAEIDKALGDAQRSLAGIDPSLGMMFEISRLSNDIRENAGLRSTLLSRYAATMKPFNLAERVEATEAAGAVKNIWVRIQRLAQQVGDGRISAAIERVKTNFLEQGEPVYVQMMDAARTGAVPPRPFLAFRAWTVDRLTDALAARDVPIAEISKRLDGLRDGAIRASTIGLAAIGGLFVLLIGAGLLVERRVLRPIAAFTGTLDAFTRADPARAAVARGGVELAARHAERRDEIGSLARAVDRIRTYALDLETLNQRFDALLANLPHGVSLYDQNDVLTVANRRYAELYSLDGNTTLLGLSLREIGALREAKAGRPIVGADVALREALAVGGVDSLASSVVELPDGRVLSLSGVRMPGGGWLSTHLDITEARRAEAQLAFIAEHDPLTGLANRSLLARTLEAALARVRGGSEIAFLYLDLDGFKSVNDTLGHTFGDELLKQVAHRLPTVLRATDTVARLGGDEFAIVVDAADLDLAGLAQQLIETISQPYDLEGCRAETGASIGIAVGPRDGCTAGDLLRAADMAMYQAKLDGRGAFRFFQADMDESMQLRRRLEFDMRGALARGEFKLNYQPILNIERGQIAAFEALLRWNHPTRGRVSPAEFIPLAEDSGIIVEIGAWVLAEACREAKSWPRGIKVSVNLSPRQFKSERLFGDIFAALAETGLPAGRLELEITERVMLINTDPTLAMLHQLRQLGVSIAMDDFGTGYSSLSYLRRFPFDKIKVDQSFIRDIARDPDSVAIVRAVTDLAAGLRMTTTAEGVETTAQYEQLRDVGVTEIQGYLISRPVSASDIPALLAAELPVRSAA